MNNENLPAKNNHINLTDMGNLDLSTLDESQRAHIVSKFAESKVELTKKAQQMNMDLGATRTNLGDLTSTVRDATTDGTSVTITHSQTTSLGRTEVVMGNTERAAKGKMSRTGAGEGSGGMMGIVAMLCVAGVIIAMIMGG
ncbi:hypothetical protein EDB69_3727 [Vibrio crassostreae]|uniref:hypothetical protein n=1 Tax=Vibrio crassostreae TaxID=246167 RepID=UPI000F4882CD|nr:hypothetical protein [Vibrio crassostreae]ROO68700.1 hypothetical protein EDB64_3450 [Vibrio crassostreae]ROP04556.1 hypothetical protein EDB63_3489 [Vibrio crassostreae]RPE90561.1 hypothetical protein EDB68_3145 [Vibrio crassostreae]RPF13744.1 hypothetical protein EDB69_3727 [Vibrio crassostreae]